MRWPARSGDGRAGRYIRRVPFGSVAYEAEGWGNGELVFEDGLPGVARAAARAFRARRTERTRWRSGSSRTSEAREDSFADVELDLEWCTEFQRSALEAMREIPYGETATYGEVAALAGHLNAQRAVGTVCAQNRFGLVVPCHRVVAADGLGSYGSLGVGYKRRLLELEGVSV